MRNKIKETENGDNNVSFIADKGDWRILLTYVTAMGFLILPHRVKVAHSGLGNVA